MRYRAAAVVLALAAAAAIGQVPMYSDYPWGLVSNGVDQGPVYNLNCKPPLWCSIPSYGDGVIQLGDGGVLPVWVAYANDAGWAERSLRANFSDDAGFADLSGTASFALDAGFAFTSGSAGTSLYAFDAGAANYATAAGVAAYALDAGQANYAPQAGNATTAGTATYALDAGQANYATSAGSAGTATTAAYAADAGNVVCTGCIISGLIASGAIIREKIAYNAVNHTVIEDGGILGNNIIPGGVTSTQIAAGGVATANIATGAVTANEIGALAVTEAKINTGAVTNTKLGDLSISSGKLQDSAVIEVKLATGAVTNTKIGALAVDSAKLAAAAVTTAKIATGAVTSNELGAAAVTTAKIATGAVTSNELGAAAVTTAKLATGAVTTNELGALAVTTAKIASGAVTTNELGANAVTNAKLALLSVATGNIQTGAVTANELGSGSVTNAKLGLLSVATGNLQDTAVTTSKIADSNITSGKVAAQAIDWTKLDDGSPIMAWDEGRGSLLAGRVTFTNGGTLQVPEANQGYSSWAVTSGTTDFYVETDVQFRTVKDQYVSITYRTGGTTGWAASSTMKVVNMGNTAQTATATMYGDGLWHTAVFDISAWTGTSTVRFDAQDGGAAIGAGATFWVANLAVGSVGVGPGGGHTLSSYRGNVGINVAKPTYQLEVGGSIAQFPTLFSINATAHATSRRVGMLLGDWLVGQDSSGNGTKDFFIYGGTTPASVMGITASGNVLVNKPASGAALTVTGTEGAVSAIVSSSSAASAFPQLQVQNYGAAGGYPVLATYNSRGSVASPSQSISGDLNGVWVAYGRTLSAFTEGTRIESRNTGSPGASTLTTSLDFWTSNNAANAAQMRLAANGALYIGGAANAEEKLEIRTATNNYGMLHSNGTIKVGTYISGEGQIGTKSNHDFALFANNGAGSLRITAAGQVRVPALAGVGNRAVYSDANGALTNTSSDATLKEDVQDLRATLRNALQLRPVSFLWKDKERFGPQREIGFIAQEVMQVVPEVVGVNSDGTYTVDYPKLVAVLVGAIQELFDDRTWLARRVQALEDKAEAAEKRLADLEARLAALEAK